MGFGLILLKSNNNRIFLATVKFEINILNSSGDFELLEGGALTVSGNIRLLNESYSDYHLQHPVAVSEKMELNSEDFYKELRLRGYQYKDNFLGFIEANIDGNLVIF